MAARYPATQLTPTSWLYDFLKEEEGLVLVPYQDVAGSWHIGVGHLIRPDEHFEVITEAQAVVILQMDVDIAVAAVRRQISADLTLGEFEALVSFTFNLGEGNLASSTLRRKVNAGDYSGASSEFARWVYAGGERIGGLVHRRADERARFDDKDGSASASAPAPAPGSVPQAPVVDVVMKPIKVVGAAVASVLPFSVSAPVLYGAVGAGLLVALWVAMD